jgi:nitrogen fixation protein FixH
MMNSESNTYSKQQHWYKSPWLIGWLFLVLTVLIVNGYMIYQSMNDFPGLVVDDFYERGQDYEENILKKLENNQKWVTEFKLGEFKANQASVIGFSLKDKDGKAADVDKITLFAYRPSNAKQDFSIAMSLSEDNTTYQASISFNQKGKWDLLASVVINGTEVNYARSIFVKD